MSKACRDAGLVHFCAACQFVALTSDDKVVVASRLKTTIPHLTPSFQTELLKVTDMTCGDCTSNVTQALNAMPGVGDVKGSLAAGEATMQYDEHLASPDQLKSAAKCACYEVDGTSVAHIHQSKGGGCS